MAGNRSAAWAVPVLVLAIPSVMFYVWWSHLNAEQKKQMTMKIRRRTPEVFTAAPTAPLANPIADGAPTAASAPAPTPTPDPAAQQAAAPVPTDAPNPAAQPATEAAAAPPALAGAGIGAQMAALEGGAPAPGQEQAPNTGAQAAPPVPSEPLVAIPRDPTMSPYDIVRIEQRRLEAEMREREAREMAARQRNRRSPPVENKIELQGIVGTPDSGNKAIVNGDMVGEGETVMGAKIVRITSQGVVFIHNGRKFTKTISRE